MTAERLDHLITQKDDHSTLGQITYLDDLYTAVALWSQRPGEVDRLANILDTLITEVARSRNATSSPSP